MRAAVSGRALEGMRARSGKSPGLAIKFGRVWRRRRS